MSLQRGEISGESGGQNAEVFLQRGLQKENLTGRGSSDTDRKRA